MKIIISVTLAYAMCGLARAIKDIGSEPIDRPAWAHRPTPGMLLLVCGAWWYVDMLHTLIPGQKARAIAFGIVSAGIKLGLMSAYFWTCISIAGWLFENVLLQILTSVVLMLLGIPVYSLVGLLVIPLTLLLAFPLDWMFPLKDEKR